jgi:anti-anti-sigma factor
MVVDDADGDESANTGGEVLHSAAGGPSGTVVGTHSAGTVVSTYSVGPATVIRVVGEFDALSAPAVWQAAHAAFDRNHARVVVDLTEAVFLDSFGVATLFGLHRRALRRRSSISVVAAERQAPRRVLRLAEADCVLPVRATVREALGGAATDAAAGPASAGRRSQRAMIDVS